MDWRRVSAPELSSNTTLNRNAKNVRLRFWPCARRKFTYNNPGQAEITSTMEGISEIVRQISLLLPLLCYFWLWGLRSRVGAARRKPDNFTQISVRHQEIYTF